MGFRFQSSKDVAVFTLSVTLLAIVASEVSIGLLYLFGGPGAFHHVNAMIFAAIVPAIIGIPICLAIARMSLTLSRAQTELQQLADTDPLTQLPNRRSFFHQADACLKGQRECNQPAALMVIDADHFKELNDNFGHAVGDQALVVIAQVLRDSFRQSDLICRVGGEEFAVLVPGMTMADAKTLASRVVDKVAASPLLTDTAVIEFSVSCGVADTHTSFDLAALFKAADDAMYIAKSQGRNRVVLRTVAAA